MSEPVSIRLTRSAGPNAPVVIDLLVDGTKAYKAPLQLKVGGSVVSGLAGDAPRIPAREVAAVLRALTKSDEAVLLTPSGVQWTLSLAGASAVLLKMDEVQGRLGTPGALVRWGSRSESAVPLPLKPPEIIPVVPLPARTGDAALAPFLLAAIDRAAVRERCSGDPFDPRNVQVFRLTDRQVLLSMGCLGGAYNSSSLLWRANDRPPHQPQLLEAEGDFDPATGTVHSAMKVRGAGDCWWIKQWTFDGTGFVLSQESGDSMCRGFAGGAWQLPAYVSQAVIPAAPISKKLK